MMTRTTTAACALMFATTLVHGVSAAWQAERPALSGQWVLNGELSTAGEAVGPPDGGPRGGRPPGGPGGGMPGGGMPGGPGGGGFGGGMGRRGGAPPARPSAEEMEARRALFDELLQPPSRFTLIQKGDAITIMEPDGAVRTYVVNGKTEKHQLTNGVVVTRSRWKNGGIEMELTVDRLTLVRSFALRDGPSRQLAITTAPKGVPRDRAGVAVYDEAPEAF